MNEYYNMIGLFRDSSFGDGFAVAILMNMVAVKNEDAGTTNHTNRIALANKILVSGQEYENARAYVTRFVGAAISAGGVVSTTGTKADWDYCIAVVLDTIANAEAGA